MTEHLDEPSNQDLLLSRRRLLGVVGAAGAAALLAACGRGSSADSASAGTTTSTTSAGATTTTSTTAPATTSTAAESTPSCVITPQETAGPYPLDLHTNSAFFRRDITEGHAGVPLAVALTILNASCKPLTNARVDIWHTDKDGAYSGYGNAVGQTFCRGIQLTDQNGKVTFDTIYPGWYQGRVTHIHFQVFLNDGLVATSQLAFPESVTKEVYASSLYASRGQNTSVPTNAADGIFRDGVGSQTLALSGSPASGYAGSLVVGVRA